MVSCILLTIEKFQFPSFHRAPDIRGTAVTKRARAASFRVGGLERQTSKDESTGEGGGGGDFNSSQMPRMLIRKLINEILKYKLSVLKKQYFYPIEIDKHLFSPIIKFTIIH